MTAYKNPWHKPNKPHGVKWAAEYVCRTRMNIDTVLVALGFRCVGVAR